MVAEKIACLVCPFSNLGPGVELVDWRQKPRRLSVATGHAFARLKPKDTLQGIPTTIVREAMIGCRARGPCRLSAVSIPEPWPKRLDAHSQPWLGGGVSGFTCS